MSILIMNHIGHTYSQDTDNEVHVLEALSLALTHGDSCALLGPSGSGKSTLLHIMGLLLRPTCGSYSLDGVDTMQLRGAQRADVRLHKIGCIIQDYALLGDRSALDNVITPLLIKGGYGKKQVIEMGREALGAVALEAVATRQVGKLSGGQRQRVAIARALITQPSLVLADEPTAQLDNKTAHMITELLLKSVSNQATLVFATHDTSLTQAFHTVIHMGQQNKGDIGAPRC